MKSVKTQFALDVKFSRTRDGQKQEMEHHFRQRDPAVFNRNNAAAVSEVFRRFIDEVKDEIDTQGPNHPPNVSSVLGYFTLFRIT